MKEKQPQKDEESGSHKEKFEHFVKDMTTGKIDINAVNSALYHMGYLLVGKKELHEYCGRVKEEVDNAHTATLKRASKKSVNKY